MGGVGFSKRKENSLQRPAPQRHIGPSASPCELFFNLYCGRNNWFVCFRPYQMYGLLPFGILLRIFHKLRPDILSEEKFSFKVERSFK
jgi:hypothetical protein